VWGYGPGTPSLRLILYKKRSGGLPVLHCLGGDARWFLVQLTVYKRFRQQDLLQTIRLFISERVRWEMRLASENSWARHHLKRLSWRSQLIITWTGNVSCTQYLTSWSAPFWLVFLTKHEVLHCYTRRTWSTAAWLADNFTSLADSLQQTVDASKFSTPQFTNSLRAPYHFHRHIFLIWIACSCEIFTILFIFTYI